MLLNKITINNLGIFSGKHEIDLSPKTSKDAMRPIIIFGGMNGSGKTTIFDSIKLCLYGSEIFTGLSDGQYKKYLREKINSSNGTHLKANHASVQIEFEYSLFGQRNTYQVERFWETNEGRVIENLSIKKNGVQIDDVDKDHWQIFIKEMIPIGLSQLFFFDGEKIQKMMHDNNNTELKRSIMSLLGLDLIERLQADLKIYKRNLIKNTESLSIRSVIDQYEVELTEVDKEIKRVQDLLSQLQPTIERTETQISDHENRIEAQGGEYFKRKEELSEKKNSIEKELDILKDRIREIAAGLLPVTLAGKLADKLKAQVMKEERIQSDHAINCSLNKKLSQLKEYVGSRAFVNSLRGVKIEDKVAFKDSLLINIRNRLIDNKQKVKEDNIHQLSAQQKAGFINKIDYAKNTLPTLLGKLTREYEQKYREAQSIYTKLAKVPDVGMLTPLYQKLNDLNIRFGALKNEQKNLAEQKRILDNKKAEIERKLKNIMLKNKEIGKYKRIEGLVEKTEQVISEYHNELSKKKIIQLEKEFTEIFLMLHRKEDLISKIKINPETCDVYMYDKYNSKLNKNNLSSGELEIYAMSMVWALAKVSGRKLPFIIDTPLARLDSKHRDNLINLFFPHASHQMLIFSTNTEVDERYFNQLKPYIAKSYRFEYIDDEKKTEIKKGYFWN